MAGFRVGGRTICGGVVLVLLVGAVAGAWLERDALRAWFYVGRLTRSSEADLGRWVERVAGLGEPALPRLIGCLRQEDPAACGRARAALGRMAGGWGLEDARASNLALRLLREWPRLSTAGQEQVLGLAAEWVPARGQAAPPSSVLVQTCGRMLAAVTPTASPEVRVQALELCSALLRQGQEVEALSGGRELVRAGLRADKAGHRVRAIQVALYPGMDLLEEVAELLKDPDADVRRAALLAVGPADQVVRDESLLPALHDSDPEVRRLCEETLTARGLRPEHLKLGRLLTDPRAVNRLEVLDHLQEAADLDPGLWLRRLSHDPSPAVRVAALRVMAQQSVVDLTDRIDQMARSDPSPTVAALAQYYLKSSQPKSGR